MLDAEKLAEMRDKQIISEQEYVEEKKRLAEKTIAHIDQPRPAKSGIIYIILAWFLGITGIHNFYAGYWGRGLAQLCLSLASPWFLFIPLLVVGVWVFGELLFENKGPHGVPFKGSRKVIRLLRVGAVIWFVVCLLYTSPSPRD